MIGKRHPAHGLFGSVPAKQEPRISIEGKAGEAAGFVKEEAFEDSKSPESKEMAQEGGGLTMKGASKTASRQRLRNEALAPNEKRSTCN
jgi:hypothetical protein